MDKKKKSPGRDERGRFTKENKIGEKTRFEKENAAACKYDPKYADELIKYFSTPPTRVEMIKKYDGRGNVCQEVPVIVANEYPTFEQFAFDHRVTTKTLLNWCEKSERFKNAYDLAKQSQLAKVRTCGVMGLYNGNFARLELTAYHDLDVKASDNEVNVNVVVPGSLDDLSK